MVDKDRDQGEQIDQLRSELNQLKKAQISYMNEKDKIITKLQQYESKAETTKKFCSGCKVELLFTSDRSPGKSRSNKSDDSTESLKTEITQNEDLAREQVASQIQLADNLPKLKKQDSTLSRTE